jgi:hypothetical protein
VLSRGAKAFWAIADPELHALLDQIVAWGGALKALRQQEAEETAMA